jgi:hypothetical protein
MRTDFMASMGPWLADEPDTNNQSGQGSKSPDTRKGTVTPTPPKK